jgi:hypothetical protein
MATITFDTHQFISTLIDAGFELKQAEAVSAAFKAAQNDADIASVRDLREMELRIESKIDKVTSELKVDLIKWMAGSLVAQAAVIATLVKLL